MNRPQFIRRLQFGKGEYEEMLAHMDASGAGKVAQEGGGNDGRIRDRFEYPVADVPLSIEHPEGGTSRFLVFGRNISRTGIGVLHGGFVYPGSPCQVVLSDDRGERRVVRGHVVHCRLFAGSCHEIGIRFEEEIDIDRLARPGAAKEEAAEAEAAGFRSITGTILYAESFAPDAALLSHQLSLFKLDLQNATTTGAVLDAVKKDPPGLILYGLDLDESALAAIRQVREAGYERPLILLTAESDVRLIARARENGATDVIPKPYYLDLLVAQLEVFLSDALPAGPVHSTMADQSGMPPLIAEFVRVASRTADQIDKACEEQDWPALRTCCHRLKGSGCSYGFQNLTVAAIAALNALGPDAPDADAVTKIAVLAGICRSLEFHEREAAA